jgi:hypothetical protein
MGHLLAEIKAHQGTMKDLMDVNTEKMKACQKAMRAWLDKIQAYVESQRPVKRR